MKLYYSPGACSLSPHIALLEAGLPYDLVKVDLRAKKLENGDDYLKINPKGQVPALQLDSGEVVTEGPVIVQMIADFPDGMVMHITSSTVNEMGTQEMIRGHKATLTMQGNKVVLTPERAFSEEVEQATYTDMNGSPFIGEPLHVHEKNWFDSIRANKQPNCGVRPAVACSRSAMKRTVGSRDWR